MSKSKRILSTLLTLAMVIAMFAAMPLTVSAATWTAENAAELETALEGFADGDTIRLLSDVTYPKEININTKKTVTFDLNGKILNATGGLLAGNGAKILLANPGNGQFNVSGKAQSGNYTVYATALESKIEVNNINTSADGVRAAYTNGGSSEIIVYGDITHTGASGRAVDVLGRSEITVNGTINIAAGVTFANVGGVNKTFMQHETATSKPGYFEYKEVTGSFINYLWVKDPFAGSAPAETNPFRVTQHPAGAAYMLNETAAPLKATFEYDDGKPYGGINSEYPMKTTWYWSLDNSNTGRSNELNESDVGYNSEITHTTTHTPVTNTIGVRYYYAVLVYEETILGGVNLNPSSQITVGKTNRPREAVTDPAKIEVTAPATAKQDLTVKKTDNTGKLLSGATIRLVSSPDNTVYEAITGANGTANFSVPYGSYTISESKAPEGYSPSGDIYKISVSAGGVFYDHGAHLEPYETVTFVNIPVTAPTPSPGMRSFTVNKTDEDGKPLAGAAIRVEGLSDSGIPRVYDILTNSGGKAEFSVENGAYELTEHAAPAGYNASSVKYGVTVKPDGVFIGTGAQSKPYEEVTFINKLIPTLNKDDHFAFMQGYPEGTFGQGLNMTRAEAVVMFSRLLTKSMNESADYRNNFYPDVPATEWYANQVGYMQQLGVLAAYSRDGKFRPDEPVTRAEFAALASHFDNLVLTDANRFSDVPDSHWAVKYINSAEAKGWIAGYPDGTFRPEANITRAEVVTLVGRMLNRYADSAYLTAKAGSLPRSYSDLTGDFWGYLPIMEASIGHDYIRDGDGREQWTAVYK